MFWYKQLFKKPVAYFQEYFHLVTSATKYPQYICSVFWQWIWMCWSSSGRLYSLSPYLDPLIFSFILTLCTRKSVQLKGCKTGTLTKCLPLVYATGLFPPQLEKRYKRFVQIITWWWQITILVTPKAAITT